jgi:hypothetical protein
MGQLRVRVDDQWVDIVGGDAALGPLVWQGAYTGGAFGLGTTPTNFGACAFTAPWAGTYAIWVSAFLFISAGSGASANMNAAVDGVKVHAAAPGIYGNANSGATIIDFGFIDLVAGAHTAQAIAVKGATGSVTIQSIVGLVQAVRRGT